MEPEQINKLIKSSDNLKKNVGNLFGINFREFSDDDKFNKIVGKYSKGMKKMYEVLAGRKMNEEDKKSVEEFTNAIVSITDGFSESLKEDSPKEIEENKEIKEIKEIAIWTEDEWALGRVANGIQKYSKHDITIIDWSFLENNVDFWKNEGWKDFDIITGNSAITTFPWSEEGSLLTSPPSNSLLRKLRPVIHSPCKGNIYEEKMTYPPYRISGVSREIIEGLASDFNQGPPRHLHSTTPGIDLDLFKQNLRKGKIKTLGYVGDPSWSTSDESKESIKRSKMFKEICEKGSFESKFIYDRPLSEGSEMFEGVDCVICTSLQEGVPLSIAEAAASGCTILTTKVGIFQDWQGIIFIENAEDAINKIKALNENDLLRNNYTKSVSDFVRKSLDWKVLINAWDSFFDSEVTDENIKDLSAPVVEEKIEEEKESNILPDEAKKKVSEMMKIPVKLSDGTMYNASQ